MKLTIVGGGGFRVPLVYTALTRATQTLTIAHATPLPEALQPAGTSHTS